MYMVLNDGEIVSFGESEYDALLSAVDGEITLTQTQFTPELLTAMSHTEQPFSTLSAAERETVLYERLRDVAPITDIATESVLAELETIARHGPENTPDDVHPSESDRHTEELRQWFSTHVSDQFEDDVAEGGYEMLEDLLSNERNECWSNVKQRIGNPARAEVTDIESEIDRLNKNWGTICD